MLLRRAYPSDLSDEALFHGVSRVEWAILEPLIPAPKPGGRPAKVPRREIVNAMPTFRTSPPMPMETPPDPQVHDLGLVASALDRIRLVESVDRLVGPRPGEKVSTGMALKAAILNALGEWAPRRRLDETGSSLPDQKGRPTQRPTLRWVFELFL